MWAHARACACTCVCVCLRQQFRAAQSMLGSLSLQIRQEKITQVHRGESPPSPTLSVCLPLPIAPSISSPPSRTHLSSPTSTVGFFFLFFFLFTCCWEICNCGLEERLYCLCCSLSVTTWMSLKTGENIIEAISRTNKRKKELFKIIFFKVIHLI